MIIKLSESGKKVNTEDEKMRKGGWGEVSRKDVYKTSRKNFSTFLKEQGLYIFSQEYGYRTNRKHRHIVIGISS